MSKSRQTNYGVAFLGGVFAGGCGLIASGGGWPVVSVVGLTMVVWVVACVVLVLLEG